MLLQYFCLLYLNMFLLSMISLLCPPCFDR